MADRPNQNYICPVKYERRYGYYPIVENIYNQNQAAQDAMIRRIERHPLFDQETGHPRPCECRTVRKKRCPPEDCQTAKAGFQCPLSCEERSPGCTCKNRSYVNEEFLEVVQIRAHRDVTKGAGLFLLEEVKKGAVIGEVCGVLGIGNEMPNKFCFPFVESFKRAKERRLYLDLSRHANEFRYLNTDCQPNAELVTYADGNKLRMVVKTTKQIKKSAELTVAYPHEMLKKMGNHECNKSDCYIKELRKQEEERARPPEGRARLRPRPAPAQRGARQNLMDAGTSNIYFEFPGLGPVQGVGIARRSHLRGQLVRDANPVQHNPKIEQQKDEDNTTDDEYTDEEDPSDIDNQNDMNQTMVKDEGRKDENDPNDNGKTN